MGIFTDYVDNYKDLVEAYNASGALNYDAYVNKYSDLASAYQATGKPDYNAYVDSNPDLAWAWNSGLASSSFNQQRQSTPITKEEWGKSHWEIHGNKEGRYMPIGFSQTKAEWGKTHWENHGKWEKREVPVEFSKTKEAWGSEHWANAGKNEARILPGAKIAVNNNGSVYIANPKLIGAGALNRYTGLVNSINNASSGNYPDLINSVKNTLDSTELKDFIQNNGKDIIEASYTTKISLWDPITQGAQPPVGGFNANYYGGSTKGGQQALQEWNAAQSALSLGGVAIPNLDITKRYTKDSYLHWYYTTQGS